MINILLILNVILINFMKGIKMKKIILSLCLTKAVFGMDSNKGECLKNFIKEAITENESIFPFSTDYFEKQVVEKIYKVLENNSLPYIDSGDYTNFADYYTTILNSSKEEYEGCMVLDVKNSKVEQIDMKKSLLKYKCIVPHIIKIYKQIKNNNI